MSPRPMKSRLAQRLQVSLKVFSKIDKDTGQRFGLKAGDRFEASAEDISILGIGASTKYFFPKGLSMQLEISGEPLGLKGPIKVKGEIRHCEYVKPHQYRCGIKFIDISEEHKNAIKQYISSKA